MRNGSLSLRMAGLSASPHNVRLRQVGTCASRRRHPHSASLRPARSSHGLRDTPAGEGRVGDVSPGATRRSTAPRSVGRLRSLPPFASHSLRLRLHANGRVQSSPSLRFATVARSSLHRKEGVDRRAFGTEGRKEGSLRASRERRSAGLQSRDGEHRISEPDRGLIEAQEPHGFASMCRDKTLPSAIRKAAGTNPGRAGCSPPPT